MSREPVAVRDAAVNTDFAFLGTVQAMAASCTTSTGSSMALLNSRLYNLSVSTKLVKEDECLQESRVLLPRSEWHIFAEVMSKNKYDFHFQGQMATLCMGRYGAILCYG